MRTRSFLFALLGLVTLVAERGTAQFTEPALLRVYALNPEGVVIPTIQLDATGDPASQRLLRSVTIAVTDCPTPPFPTPRIEWIINDDWDSFRGVCAGNRTIEVTYNGITLRDTVDLHPGEEATLTFVFPRDVYPIATVIDLVGNSDTVNLDHTFSLRCAPPTGGGPDNQNCLQSGFAEFASTSRLVASASGTVCYYSAVDATTEATGRVTASTSYTLNSQIFSYRQFLSYTMSGNHVRGVDLETSGVAGTRSFQPRPVSIPARGFQRWFVQYFIDAGYPTLSLVSPAGGGANAVTFPTGLTGRQYVTTTVNATTAYTAAHMESDIPRDAHTRLHPFRLQLHSFPDDDPFNCPSGSWSDSASNAFDAFLSRLSMASVPFDVLGTGVVIPIGPSNQPPAASFTFVPQTPMPGDTVSFDGSSSRDPDGIVVTYEWNFGDGTPALTGSQASATHSYATPGRYTVTLTATDDDGATDSVAETVVVGTRPDLRITRFTPVQVVDRPELNDGDELDFVLDKPAVVHVELGIDTQQRIGPADSIVTALYWDSTLLTSVTRTYQQLVDAAFKLDLYFTPAAVDDGVLRVVVDPPTAGSVGGQIDEENESNNDDWAQAVIWDTKPLKIHYVRVDCFAPVDQAAYLQTEADASAFIKGFFPIAPSDVESTVGSRPMTTCPIDLDHDLRTLWVWGRRENGSADRVVGIASSAFFRAYFPTGNTDGATRCTDRSLFSEVGQWLTVGHELMHTLGWYHFPDTGCNIAISGGSTDGWWLGPGVGASGLDTAGKRSLMDYAARPAGAFPQGFERWITWTDYKDLFAMRATGGPADPEVILVSGFVNAAGDVQLAPLYRLPAGIIDSGDPGNMSVRVVNESGDVLHSTSFGVSFVVQSDPPVVLDRGSFGFAVPYLPGAVAIEIARDNVVVVRQSLASRLLRDAIAAIPDDGFDRNPSQRRAALLNQIGALDAMLEHGAPGAGQFLGNVIRPELTRRLVDGYVTRTPLEVGKTEMLELVDALLQRLGN